MEIKEIRKLNIEQLEKEVEKFSKEFIKVSKNIREGKEKDVRKGLRIKRIIARIQTVLNEKIRDNLKQKENEKGKERESK